MIEGVNEGLEKKYVMLAVVDAMLERVDAIFMIVNAIL